MGGRASSLLALAGEKKAEQVEAEIERLDFRPENIDADTWQLIQDNGRLATERLHDILKSPRFTRLNAGDQAKLIALAQNRAYGMPQTHRQDPNKHRGSIGDATAAELSNMASRAALPEYRTSVMDAELSAQDDSEEF